MNLNGMEWNRTEQKKMMDVYVRGSRVFCVSVSELLNPMQYPSIKFGSETVLEQNTQWSGNRETYFYGLFFVLMIVDEKNESIL